MSSVILTQNTDKNKQTNQKRAAGDISRFSALNFYLSHGRAGVGRAEISNHRPHSKLLQLRWRLRNRLVDSFTERAKLLGACYYCSVSVLQRQTRPFLYPPVAKEGKAPPRPKASACRRYARSPRGPAPRRRFRGRQTARSHLRLLRRRSRPPYGVTAMAASRRGEEAGDFQPSLTRSHLPPLRGEAAPEGRAEGSPESRCCPPHSPPRAARSPADSSLAARRRRCAGTAPSSALMARVGGQREGLGGGMDVYSAALARARRRRTEPRLAAAPGPPHCRGQVRRDGATGGLAPSARSYQ